MVSRSTPGSAAAAIVRPAETGLDQYFRDLVARRRMNPRDDAAAKLSESDLAEDDLGITDFAHENCPRAARQDALLGTSAGNLRGVDAIDSDPRFDALIDPDSGPHDDGVAVDDLQHSGPHWPRNQIGGAPRRGHRRGDAESRQPGRDPKAAT